MSVPLRAVFFLKQAPVDECLAMKQSNAAISLAASALQVFRSIDFGFPRREEANVKKAPYDNAASLAMVVPSYLLHVSLTGRFWKKIEEVLGQEAPLQEGIYSETVCRTCV
jgi:SynChlorMet cassette protein ScmC